MQVVHATWGPGQRLHLWAEDTEVALQPAVAAASPGDGTDRHPFAATAFTLPLEREQLTLSASGPGLHVRLPARHGRPLPSPSLVAETGEDGGPIEWADWTVPAAQQEP